MPGNTESILYDTNGDPLAVDDGVAIPSGTPMIIAGGSDGTNSRYIKVDSTGNQILVGLGTAGSPAGGVITIQGDSSGTPLPISGTITANAGSGNFAVVQATAALLNATVTANGNFNNASVSGIAASPPASATYIGGSVTTSSPTYTTGQMNPLSLTTAGALRIDGSAVTQPISGTVTANAGTGTFTIAGTVTSNQGTSPWVTNITQFGGSNVVTGTGTSGSGIPRVTVSNDSNILATQSGSWTVTSNQGTAAALSGAWPVKVTDGTNVHPTGDVVGRSVFNQISDATTGPVAVKDASIAPTATDKALVVVLSPNQQSIPVAVTPATANGGLKAGFAKLGGGTAGLLIPVLSTTYTEQSSNAQRSMSSSSTSDTSAGVGARSVTITYYTATFTGPFTETITLNGTTAVNTTNTNICYIESMVVTTVGSTGVNVGTITLYASTGGAGGSVASIGTNTLTGSTGDSRTLYAQHYIASGKVCYVTGFYVSASGSSTFFLKSKTLNISNEAEYIFSDVVITTNPFERAYGTAVAITGPARIVAYAIPSSNNTTVNASFDFFEQ